MVGLGANFRGSCNCIILGTATDPCCGSGGMFVQSLKFVDRHNGNRQKVSFIGQETQAGTEQPFCEDVRGQAKRA